MSPIPSQRDSWKVGLLTVCLAAMIIGLTACADDAEKASSSSSSLTQAGSSITNAAGLSGQDLYQPCLLCHSTKEMQRGPILNGLPAWYVENQMRKFRDGVRGSNPENRAAVLMAGTVTQLLQPADSALVARHIKSLPVSPHLLTVHGDQGRGRKVYLMCVPCHGDRAQGNPLVKSPPLNVQEDWYLLDQLRKFKAGLRGDHREDLEGKTMTPILLTLDDTQLRDVVAYLAGELFRADPVPDSSEKGN